LVIVGDAQDTAIGKPAILIPGHPAAIGPAGQARPRGANPQASGSILIQRANGPFVPVAFVIDSFESSAFAAKQRALFGADPKDAVAGFMASRLKVVDDLKQATKEAEELGEELEGAEALGAKRVQQIGADKAATDPQILDLQAQHDSISAALVQKKERIAALEARAAELNDKLSDYKAQLIAQKNALEAIHSEHGEAVADARMANEVKALNDAAAGIATDGADADLANLRERNRRLRAGMTISQELAGTDTNGSRAKLRAAAQASKNGNAFLSKIGAAPVAAAPEAVAPVSEPEKLPE